MTKTYFLVSGWDFSAESIPLGSIITNPTHPQISLFKPSPSDLVSSPIHTTTKPDFTSSIDVAGNGSTGLFCTFLSLFGLGDEAAFQYDRKNVLSYSFTQLQAHALTPGHELLATATTPDGEGVVAQFLRASVFKTPVYMVTGVKTIKGAGVTMASSKGKGWRVSLGVGAGTESETHASHHDASAGEPAPVVFAFELIEVRVSAEGEVVRGGFVGAQEELQNRLDGEFGANMLTVLQGFDEEDGLPCQIIAPSPTCVDLLTASSARIDASRWRGTR